VHSDVVGAVEPERAYLHQQEPVANSDRPGRGFHATILRETLFRHLRRTIPAMRKSKAASKPAATAALRVIVKGSLISSGGSISSVPRPANRIRPADVLSATRIAAPFPMIRSAMGL